MQDDPRLTNLLTYTTFHIGVYISLITAFIASSILVDEKVSTLLLRYSSACVVLAGMFGGVVGSNIPHFKTYQEMRYAKLTAFGLPAPNLKWCIHFEHLFFWAGVLPVAALFILGGTNALHE